MAPADGKSFADLSVKQLKESITSLGGNFTGMTEKSELVACLEKLEAEKPEVEADEEAEDEPIVKDLKELDDQYLALEREFEAEERALRAKFKERQNPLLKQRSSILADASEADAGAEKCGTPALQGFWCATLGNHPSFGRGDLQEWDVAPLEYLKDITSSLIEDEDHLSFRLDFIFAENPFFVETLLSKTYTVREDSPWNGEQDVKEIKSTKITWKPGQDVTVSLTKKKVKGGGAKKAKQAKDKIEPRISFFRTFLDVNLSQGAGVPESLEVLAEQMTREMASESGQAPEDLAPESCAMFMMERDYGMGLSIKDAIIPYAIRFYTGEACPDGDEGDDDDEDDEDGDDDDDDDDDDEEEVEMESKPKAKAKSKGEKKPAAGGAGGKKEEDCKQQ